MESLEKKRQPLPHLEAVYIVVPSDAVRDSVASLGEGMVKGSSLLTVM